jgi:hypothetical protein
MKKYCLESTSRGISYMKYVNGRRTGLVESAFCNGLLKERYKRGIDVTGRQGRRRRKLLDDLKERRGYYHLKEVTVDRTMWRGCFGRGFGPVVRQTTKLMNDEYIRAVNEYIISVRYMQVINDTPYYNTCCLTRAASLLDVLQPCSSTSVLQ